MTSIENGTHVLRNIADRKHLAMEVGVVSMRRDGEPLHYWDFEKADSGNWVIRDIESGTYLGTNDGGYALGTPLIGRAERVEWEVRSIDEEVGTWCLVLPSPDTNVVTVGTSGDEDVPLLKLVTIGDDLSVRWIFQ